MNKNLILVLGIFMVAVMQSCKSYKNLTDTSEVVDNNASIETLYLLHRINKIKDFGYAFGHQDATAYGIGWKNDGTQYKSDVNEVSGDFPAIYGFEIGHIELGEKQNLDSVNFALMKRLIRKAHEKKGIITISWHPDNPISKKSAWDTTQTVKYVLKGGVLHTQYRGWLLRVADFLNDLQDSKGNLIPVVFRPYHEMNGSWFWWGEGNCTAEEYKQLWKETVAILRDEFNVHNLLYAYSVNTFLTKAEYLKYYPGDAYVDILGVDIYQHGTVEDFIAALHTDLDILSKISKEKKKPFALTETGLNMVKDDNWWTQVLDQNVSAYDISWALLWRNAWPNHFFVPYTGSASSSDFRNFKKFPNVLFLKDLKKVR